MAEMILLVVTLMLIFCPQLPQILALFDDCPVPSKRKPYMRKLYRVALGVKLLCSLRHHPTLNFMTSTLAVITEWIEQAKHSSNLLLRLLENTAESSY